MLTGDNWKLYMEITGEYRRLLAGLLEIKEITIHYWRILETTGEYSVLTIQTNLELNCAGS